MYKPAALVLVFHIVISKALYTTNANSQDDRSSLVFVFDTTGSMHDDLKQLREGAEMILDAALEANNVIADFVFVPFHDPAVGPPTVTRYKSVFKDALSMVTVHGGGDCPEKSLTGIQLALNVSRPRSFVYVFTDATAHDHWLVGNVLDLVQRKQSQVVFVLTGHCNDLKRPSYLVYQQIAAASSGQVFNLNKTNVHKVLDFVRSSIKARTVNLASVTNPAGYNYTRGIPVDSSLGEVTVSVSGSNPQIKVYSPTGQLTGPPKLVTTLDLAEIMVVKVLQPEPGNWSILVGSEDEHSVKVVGLSNLTFQHGFSLRRPKTGAETSYRPLKGTYNYMLLTLTQTDKPVHISFAEILSLDGKVLFEIPLTEVDPVKKVYLADAFIPPDEFFYISINGLDENNQELRRVGATAIQAKPSEVPYLSAPEKVEAYSHETVTLKCDIESLVPVTALWTKDGARIQPQISSLQSTSIEYVINNMSDEHVGTYSCVARNSAGVSHLTTEVVLLVEPPTVSISTSNTTLSIGENLTLSCSVLTETVLTKYQMIFTGKGYRNVTEIRVEPNLEGVYIYNTTLQVKENDGGVYSCVAAHRGGQNSKSLNITVSPRPTARILGPHTLTKTLNTVIQLMCDVEHTNELHWLFNGVIVERRYVNGSFNAILDKEVTGDGVWTCVAIQGLNKASDSVEIITLFKPEVNVKGSKEITIFNGTVHNITCLVEAKPEPRIIWHKETEKFLNNTVTQLSPTLYQSVLTINSTKGAVEGTYFCFGENSEGIHQDSVTVRVRRNMVLVRGFTDMSTELYSNVTLHCQIDAYPKPIIQWLHNFTELVNKPNVHTHKDYIFIEKVDFDNLGFYSCEASNKYEKVTVNGTLSVHGLELPTISKEPNRRVTLKGNTAVLSCSVLKGNPRPTVTWQYRTKSSDEFNPLHDDVKANVNRSEIVISNVRIDHEGVYRCMVENVLGTDFHDILLEVQVPPEIKSDLLNGPLEIKLGMKVTLPCQVTGIPKPIVVWTKNDKPVIYTKNVHLTSNSDLVIEEIDKFDSGLFSCNASSPLGTAWKNYTVIVYDPPKITPPVFEPQLEFLEGQLVELPCLTDGLPRPQVTWLQNGHRVDDRKYIDDFGIRFVANLTDFGDYTCVVGNLYGKTNFTYTVFIWAPPSFKLPLETEINALLGSNTSLRCDATGFPVPIIYWKFQDERISVNSTELSFNDYGNLNITQVTLEHDGRYSCIAENLGGVAGIDIYLHINEPPRIIDDNYTAPYIATDKDSLLMVSCKAAGKPRPYVYWTKDGVALDKDSRYNIDVDGTLTIKAPDKELSGEYTCVAKNIVGVANRIITVEVYSLPSHQADKSETTVTLLEGSARLVECPLNTSPGDLVTWYKDARPISTGLLSIPTVSRENASTLACVASNAVGSAFAQLHFVVEWPPHFTKEVEKEVEVVKGGDVWLDCGVDAKPSAKTKWLFNSKTLLGEEKNRLRLINIQLHQTGVYKCIVNNVHGTIVRTFSVDVLVPPFISEFDLLDVQLKVGMSATLDCNARGSPKPEIKWSYNNTEWQLTNTSLTASNVSTISEGLYRCDAVNKAGTRHLIYRVAIVTPPKIEEIAMFGEQGITVEDIAEVVIGTNVRIACKASGQPIPTIQWIKNGRIVSENRKDISYADLVLQNVNINHSGMYVCIATNDAGVGDKRIKVDVLETPKIYQTLFQNSNSTEKETILEVISGQAFNLHCHVYGNPVPDVFWFKDGIPLRLFDDTMVSTDFGEVIQSPSALLEQSGNYTCIARNRVGNTSIVYLVDVLVPPPTPKEVSRPIDIRIGKPLALTCPVEGSPTPRVMWIRHPYTEISGSSRLILSADNVTLTIRKTETTDSGLYSCIMSNKVGITEAMFHVTILKPPSIAGNIGANITETRIVQLYRSLVLKCEVDGHPTPKISWLKDTQQLTDRTANVQQVLGNSLLAIWSMTSRATGQYICVADNDAGAAHRRYNVVAQVPGKWTGWSQWSYCNVTCGLGYQVKSRSCQYEDDYITIDDKTKSDKAVLDRSACKGPSRERRKCHMPPCEGDTTGQWSDWSKWSVCSSSCGAGTQARTRRCRGRCEGDNVQLRKCPNLPKCDADRVPTENEFNQSSNEDETKIIENDPYLPEATFEFEPNVVDTEGVPANSPSPVYEVRPVPNPRQGSCGPGYTHNETTQRCDDIDECTIENNQCHSTQICVNTAGGYRCGCDPGYFALGAGQRCLDINECEQDIDGCEFACVNVAGGYACACPRHLRLHMDRHHCVHASMYREPYINQESEYLSAMVESPAKYKNTRN